MWPEVIWARPIPTVTIASSRSMHTTLSVRPDARGLQISSSLTETSMLSILRPSRYAWMSSGGLSSASIRAASRYIPCMTWRLRYQPSSTSLRRQFMTPRRWRKFPLRQVPTTSLTVATTTSRNSIAYIVRSRSLLSGLRPICSTSASNGDADCQREYSLMLR